MHPKIGGELQVTKLSYHMLYKLNHAYNIVQVICGVRYTECTDAALAHSFSHRRSRPFLNF